MTTHITPDLQSLAVPMSNLKPLDKNPRKGNVDAMVASLQEFGQRKPIVARRLKRVVDGHPTGEIIAGNHTWKAAQALGWESIAVTWTDDDPKTAKAFALADNRTSDLGGYDDRLLAEMVQDLTGTNLLDAAGYDEETVADLIAALDMNLENDEGQEPPGSRGLGNPIISYQIIFDTDDQQRKWFEYVRWLRIQYPNADTNAERLMIHLTQVLDNA